MKISSRWIALSLGIVAILGLGGCLWLLTQLKFFPEPIIALGSYEKIAAEKARESKRYSFLPAKIDPRAEESAFYFQPGFLQGGEVIILRQKLPGSMVESLLAALEKSGRPEVVDFGKVPVRQCFPKYGITQPSQARLQKNSPGELPKGFRIFLFESDLNNIEQNSNRNFLAFTAVSLQAAEVVYYAEDW